MGTSGYRSPRLVLGRSPQDAAVRELASEEGWQLAEEIMKEGVRHIVWVVADGTALNYIEDPVSLNAYLVLAGNEVGTAGEILDLVNEELMPMSRRALLQSVDASRDALSRARAVIRVGLGAPDAFDGEFFDRIRDAFHDDEKWVREAAVWATTYSPWPEYRPLLETAAREDRDEKIRADAATVLAGFDQEGIQVL